MKIVYEGFYGFKNAGDDAFIEVSAWGAQKYWGCNNNVFLGSSLPNTINEINSKQILPSVKGFDRLNLMSHLRNSDYLISAGGSTFGDIPFHSNKAVAKTFKNIQKKLSLGAMGVSIGPFKNAAAEKGVQEYLKSLSFLAVRDHRSYQYVHSLSLPYKPINAFDLAALLPDIYSSLQIKKNSNTSVKTIGLSICNYESFTGGNLKKEENRFKYFKELVQLLSKESNIRFKLFIINGNEKIGDKNVSFQLIEGIDNEKVTIVPYLGDVKKTWDEIVSCDMMISTRLHASIFACYAKVPFFLIEYHKKCSDFLNDVGQHDDYRIFDAAVSPSETLKAVKTILSGLYVPPVHLIKTIEQSRKNFTETIPKL